MRNYKVVITKTAQKQLDKLPNIVAEDLISIIHQLSVNPRPNGCKKLKGRSGYRVRKGTYRIIYDIIDSVLIVNIIAVGHRKDIYD